MPSLISWDHAYYWTRCVILHISVSTKDSRNQSLSRSIIRNPTEEERRDPKVKVEMESLYPSINNSLVTEDFKENNKYEGVFIKEPIIYEDLAYPDMANAKPIEEEEFMSM